MYWMTQLLIVACAFAFGFVLSLIVALCTKTTDYTGLIFEGSLFLLCVQLLFGFRNGKTANDNTSGVLTLLTAMERLQAKENVAFVFFDNEEKGLIGSAYFKRAHKDHLQNHCLINFDCVGDGDTIFLMSPKKVKKKMRKEFEKLQSSFPNLSGKQNTALCCNPLSFPSDHIHFDNGIGVAAARKSKLGGYTVGRLHTMRDKKLDERNIKYLALWMKNLAKKEEEKKEEKTYKKSYRKMYRELYKKGKIKK